MVLVFFGFVATRRQRVRAARDGSRDRVVRRARGRASRRAASCSPTTSATSRPTAVAGKRTLAVRVGAARGARCCTSCASSVRSSPSSRAACSQPPALVALARGAARRPADRDSCGHSHDPPSLVAALVGTVRFQLVLAALLALGLVARPSRAAAANATTMMPPSTSRLLERQRVPAVEPHVRRRSRRSRASISRRDARRTWRRRVPVTSSTGIAAPPSRSHSGSIAPGAEHAQAARSRYSGQQSPPVGEARSVRAGPTRTSAARASACRNASTPSRSTSLGERLVGRDARALVRSSAMPGRRAHEHERVHEVGTVEREPQAQPAAHRVADVDRRRRRASPSAVAPSPRRTSRIGDRRTTIESSHARVPTSTTPFHDRRGLREAGHEDDRARGHSGGSMSRHARRHHRVRPSARRRVGARRVHRRGRRARLALGAARPRARPRRPDPRRTSSSTSARPRSARSASGSASGRPAIVLLHVGDRGRELPPRGARGASRAGAADRVHRRPPARAARHRRGPDDRPGEALRRRGALVPRSRARPSDDRRRRRGVARARVPRGRRGASGRRPGRCTSTCRSASRSCRPARRSSTRPGAPTARRGPRRTAARVAPDAADRRARSPRLVRAHPRRRRRRGLGCGRRRPRPRTRFADAAGWPVLADPISNLRDGPHAISTYDALLRAPAFAGAHRPDLVLRIGAPLTSKVANAWLDADDALRCVVDPDRRVARSARTRTSERIVADAERCSRARSPTRARRPRRTESRRGSTAGCDAERRARAAIDASLDACRRAVRRRDRARRRRRAARRRDARRRVEHAGARARVVHGAARRVCACSRTAASTASTASCRRSSASPTRRSGADRRPVRRPLLPARHQRPARRRRARRRRSSSSTTTAAASSRSSRSTTCPSSKRCSARRTASTSSRSRARTASPPSASTISASSPAALAAGEPQRARRARRPREERRPPPRAVVGASSAAARRARASCS